MTSRHYEVTVRAVFEARIRVEARSESDAACRTLELAEEELLVIEPPERVSLRVTHVRMISGD